MLVVHRIYNRGNTSFGLEVSLIYRPSSSLSFTVSVLSQSRWLEVSGTEVGGGNDLTVNSLCEFKEDGRRKKHQGTSGGPQVWRMRPLLLLL